MNNTRMIVEDEYLNELAEYFEKQGKQLQRMADAYIAVMEQITSGGIMQGETAMVLRRFLESAKKLNHVISSVSVEVRDSVMNYLEEIDTEDQYLY